MLIILDIQITILVPVKNEESAIITFIPGIVREMCPLNIPYEMLFIDDCSTDKTRAVLLDLQKKYPPLRIISIPPRINAPVGVALQLGIKLARGKYIIIMDGDGSHQPKDLKRFIASWKQGAFAVLGGRYFPNQKPFHPLSRYVISRTFNSIARWFLRTKIYDLTNGYRLFPKKLGLMAKAPDFEIHHELNLLIAQLKSMKPDKVKEIPIVYKKRETGKSKLKYVKVFPRYSFQFLKAFLKRNYRLFLN